MYMYVCILRGEGGFYLTWGHNNPPQEKIFNKTTEIPHFSDLLYSFSLESRVCTYTTPSFFKHYTCTVYTTLFHNNYF